MKRFALFLLCLLPLPALAGQSIPSGVTDQVVFFKMVDATDNVTPETGLVSGDFTVTYWKDTGTETDFTSPTVTELDSVKAPGVYKLLMDEGTTVAAGNVIENMHLSIQAAGCAPAPLAIEIVDAANEGDIATAVETEITDRLPSATTKTNLDTAFASTLAEVSGVPSATDPLWEKVGFLFQALTAGYENDKATTAGAEKRFKNAAGVTQWEKPINSDGTTYTESAGETPD